MWHAITDFLLKAHASGLGHDAVIEIMIALLGVMIAILTLVSGLIAVVVAIIGWFGYQTIRDEAKRSAADEARKTATTIAKDTLNEMWSQMQASGMSEGQAEPDIQPGYAETSIVDAPHKQRRKATRDSNLKEGDRT